MKISDFIPIVSKISPFLGAVVGTPIGGIVISIIASYFNVNKKDLSGMANAILSDPSKLKEIELKHQEEIQKMFLDFIQKSESSMPKWVVGILAFMMMIATLYLTFQGSIGAN